MSKKRSKPQNATTGAKKRMSSRQQENRRLTQLGPCYIGKSSTLPESNPNSIHWNITTQFFAALPSDVVNFYLLKFTNTFECLILMHVSKAARKIAVQSLKKNMQKVSTTLHRQMFQTFLASPHVDLRNLTKLEKVPSMKLAGPLRQDVLCTNAQRLSQQFIVLNYERTYGSEKSEICVVDSRGNFVSYYEFSSDQFYEGYVTEDVMESCDSQYVNMPRMIMKVRNVSQAPEELNKFNSNRVDYHWRHGWGTYDGFMNDIAFKNKSVLCSTLDIISPTETIFVLMHALSSDTRSIFVLTKATFDYLDRDFRSWEGEEDYWSDSEEENETPEQTSRRETREYGCLLLDQPYLHSSVKTHGDIFRHEGDY